MNTLSTGDLASAEKYATKTMNLNPNFFDSWVFLYMVYTQEGDREEKISALIKEVEAIPNKDSAIYSILLHYFKDRNPEKYNEYSKLADEYAKTVNSTALQDRLIAKIGFDEFMKLAEEAFENNTLPFNFETLLFIWDHRDTPKYKAFVEKIRKGK